MLCCIVHLMVAGYCYGFVHLLFKFFFQDSFVVPPKASNQTLIPLIGQAVPISVTLLLFTVKWESVGSRFACTTYRRYNPIVHVRGFRDKIANFSRLHWLAILRRDLSTKKTKLNIEKWPESLSRSHVRILIYRMWAIDMKMSYYSHTNKTHLHTEGFARSLVLKVRVLELENGRFTFPVRSFLL